MRTETLIVTNTCDKCGREMERKCGMVIEGLSARISGYDPRGSGGHSVKDLEFCYSCSDALHNALGLDQESVDRRRHWQHLSAQ